MKKILTAIALMICMTSVAQTDTTKKQPKQYYLIGEIGAWQLLYKAITTPGDVTPNQVKSLAEWMDRIREIPADTTQNTKKEKK